MPDLSEYISSMLKKGYDLTTIKNWLLKTGYKIDTINQAIYNLNKTQVKHTIHFSKSVVLVVIILAIGLGTTLFFIFGNNSIKPGKLLDVSIGSISTLNDISSSIDLSNMGSTESYDVYVKYELIDSDTNKRITFESETVALQTTLSRNFKFNKDLTPGNYLITVSARYEDQLAVASKEFKIETQGSEPSCFDNILNQDEENIDCGGSCTSCKKCPASCDDGNPETIDYCSNFECVNNKPSECGDNLCGEGENENSCPDDCIISQTTNSIWDQLEEIKLLAQSNPALAESRCDEFDSTFRDQCLEDVGTISVNLNICDKIVDEYYGDRCFANVAKALNKYAVCENIDKESRRDSCYMNFVIDGEYGICDKISNEYLKKSCETLAQTQ